MSNPSSKPTPVEWDKVIAGLPEPHLLQTAEWAKAKAQIGWEAFYLIWYEHQGSVSFHINIWDKSKPVRAAALVLQRSIQIGGFAARLRILYAPKGPLLDWDDIVLRKQVVTDLQAFARKQGAIFLKIDPDICLNVEIPGIDKGNQLITGQKVQQLLYSNGWRFSNEQVQFRNTVLIDLTLSEAELLERMKQKTRYNIRLASRKGVVIRRGTPEDHHLLYRMYAETSVRDSFTIRDEAYYRGVWCSFVQHDESTCSRPIVQPLIAEVDGEPVAALMLFMFANKAWYMYGMSRETHRDKMPNYLLQWEAIRLSKSVGCQVYDLWGAPEVMEPSDPLWGVYRFKEGLGGKLTRFLGAWDFPVQPLLYKFYTQTMPRLLGIMRRSGQAKIRQTMG